MRYDFECDCGRIREVICGHNEIIGHAEVCSCGKPMRRVYYPLAFTGDLPAKNGLNQYDDELGVVITSTRQRERLAEQQGLAINSRTDLGNKLRDEAHHVARNTSLSERRSAITKASASIIKDDRKKRRRAAVGKEIGEIAKRL